MSNCAVDLRVRYIYTNGVGWNWFREFFPSHSDAIQFLNSRHVVYCPLYIPNQDTPLTDHLGYDMYVTPRTSVFDASEYSILGTIYINREATAEEQNAMENSAGWELYPSAHEQVIHLRLIQERLKQLTKEYPFQFHFDSDK